MPETMTLLPMAGLLLAIGAFAGVLAGLLGVGGGIILVPAFFYVFSTLGYNSEWLMQICLATSLSTIAVTSVRSVSSHNSKGAVDWEVLKTWAPGIAFGAVIGVLVATQLKSAVLQGIFGALGICIGLYMGFARSHWRLADKLPSGPASHGASSAIGFLSVLMGVGGGSFGVPLLSLYGKPIHQAVGTAAGIGAIIAVPSVVAFLLVPVPSEVRPPYTIGAVNLIAFTLIVVTTFFTAPLGARIAHALNAKLLKRVFAVFLIVIAANMLRKALGW